MTPSPKMDIMELQELHRGGMARVSLAVTRDGQRVVLRRMLSALLLRRRDLKAFVNGLKIRADISGNDHIVGSLEHGRKGLIPYEIIEYVDGPSIKGLFQADRQKVISHSYELMRQCAVALAHMHERGYMHLDVKPENFLVEERGTQMHVKLTDFDLSTNDKPRHVRNPGGTYQYVPPEVIRNGNISQAADVFAFGVMSYQLVTGHLPFEATKEKHARWRQLSETFTVKRPRTYNPDLMPKIEKAIMQCLEKKVENRYPNMCLLVRDMGLV